MVRTPITLHSSRTPTLILYPVPTPKREHEYAHVATLDGIASDFPGVPDARSRRYGSYVVRAPPPAKRKGSRVTSRQGAATRHQARRLPPRPEGDTKRFAVFDPLAAESHQRSSTQQNRLSCIVTPTRSKSRPSRTPPPPEYPKHRRSLSRFTKELERYCVAASANGTAPLPLSTPTVSQSPTTLDTVSEFLPYHKQFKAAGLAVTSREQMPRISESGNSQPPRTRSGKGKGKERGKVAMLVDGSTATLSDQGSNLQEQPAPNVPEKDQGAPSRSQAAAQASSPGEQPATKTTNPWFRKKDAALLSRSHSGRKFSKSHIHPSLATPIEPYLTPSDRLALIDSYFDTPEPVKLQDRQPVSDNTSTSSSPPVPSNGGPRTEKLLPTRPAVARRPIPPRSERRHMENTAAWPTAGVLIHDNSPPLSSKDRVYMVEEQLPTPAKDSDSAHSWTTEEDFPELPERSPPVPPKEPVSPKEPVPPKEPATSRTASSDVKPKTPPKDDLRESQPPSIRSLQHLGISIRNKWHKAAGLRRRSSFKALPIPSTFREEFETLSEQVEQPRARPPAKDDEAGINSSAPQLPTILSSQTETTSSFEKALDAVVSRLDAMEERRHCERHIDLGAIQKKPVEPESLEKTSSQATSSKPSGDPQSTAPTSSALGTSRDSEDAAEYTDRGINDRDVLLGLKMAICAACDEDLDAWIRSKTGLRLRRFLADLKAFETISRDRKPWAPQPMSRQIRRYGRESRRMQAEQERRRRNSRQA